MICQGMFLVATILNSMKLFEGNAKLGYKPKIIRSEGNKMLQ